MKPERARQLTILLAALVATALVAFAGIHVIRWQHGGNSEPGALSVRKLELRNAPIFVQEAAAKLLDSRVAYAMPIGNSTYVVISSGAGGDRLDLVGAKRDMATGAIAANLKSNPAGERLIVAELKAAADPRMISYELDGYADAISGLLNPDALPLVRLPDTGGIAVITPQASTRLVGQAVQVTGFARVPDGTVNIQVFSAGKGRLLGEAMGVRTAATGMQWGGFKANVAMTVPAGTLEGIVLVYDPESGAKQAIPVVFAAK